jgi:hypothetical protein
VNKYKNNTHKTEAQLCPLRKAQSKKTEENVCVYKFLLQIIISN